MRQWEENTVVKPRQADKRWAHMTIYLEVLSPPIFPAIVASIQCMKLNYSVCVFLALFQSVLWSMDMWLSDMSLEKVGQIICMLIWHWKIENLFFLRYGQMHFLHCEIKHMSLNKSRLYYWFTKFEKITAQEFTVVFTITLCPVRQAFFPDSLL